MTMSLKNNLLKFFFIFSFFCFFPYLSQACTNHGGTCVSIGSCSQAVAGGAYNGTCGTGMVCCDNSTGGSNPTPTATNYQEGSTGGFLLLQGHLVPCGRNTDDPGTTDNDETRPCTLCHGFLLLKNIFDLMLSLLIIVSILFITIGGVLYIVSAGNTSLTGMAKEIIKKTLIGFALMMVGWLLVFTLLSFLSTNGMVGKGTNSWFEFTCDAESKFYGGFEPNPTAVLTPPDPSSSYTFQTGIASQMSDASPALSSFLDCMEEKLPTGAKEISSISDSAGMTLCSSTSYSRPPCAHGRDSCHYGGTAASCDNKSYAVDFGNENYGNEIYWAAKACQPNAFVLDEGNHIHVSIGSIYNCGCR